MSGTVLLNENTERYVKVYFLAETGDYSKQGSDRWQSKEIKAVQCTKEHFDFEGAEKLLQSWKGYSMVCPELSAMK